MDVTAEFLAGLYSLYELITSMPGAPERSTRFNSFRAGESCEYASTEMPAANTHAARSSPDRFNFMMISLPVVET